MVANFGVMANMIPAPHDNIVPNLYEWLNSIVFKNKAMLAHFNVVPDKGAAAYVTGQSVASLLNAQTYFFTYLIHACINYCAKYFMGSGGKKLLQVLKWNHRQTEFGVRCFVGIVDREAHDSVLGIMSKIFVGDFSKIFSAENNEVFSL